MTKYRNPLEIVFNVLKSLEETPLINSRLSTACNLDSKQFKKYLSCLEGFGLVETRVSLRRAPRHPGGRMSRVEEAFRNGAPLPKTTKKTHFLTPQGRSVLKALGEGRK